MFGNVKNLRMVFMSLCIATSMSYGSEKPNNGNVELIAQAPSTSKLVPSERRTCDPRRWDPRTQKCAAAVCSVVIIGTIATINQLRYYNRL